MNKKLLQDEITRVNNIINILKISKQDMRDLIVFYEKRLNTRKEMLCNIQKEEYNVL